MPDLKFDQPRLALNRIYTKAGDQGQTHLAGGQRVSKASPRIECYGTVDELNAFVGMAAVSAASSSRESVPVLVPILRRVQHELFNLGSILATKPEDVHPKQARITAAEIRQLEVEIDGMNAELSHPALVRAARRHSLEHGTARLPHHLPAGRAAGRRAR